MWRCAKCGMVVHPDCFDQAVKTECHASLMKSSTNLLKTQVSQEFITNFTQRQHNILLTVEEIERRRAYLCEGVYRIPGNVKEKNVIVGKINDAKNSLRLRRQVLATGVKDHNSLCSLLKHYLTSGEPILTYKFLPSFCAISCSEKLAASERKKQLSDLLEKLPDTNQQVLSCLLRHFNHVIENKQANRMSDDALARSIGPSLVGYKTPQPTARDYQAAPHYQQYVTKSLLQLQNIGDHCVLGRALKRLQDAQQSYPAQPSSGNATPNTLRRLFGK